MNHGYKFVMMDASSSQFAWPFPGLLILVATMPVVVAAAGGRRHLVDHIPATPPSAGSHDSGGGVSSSDDATENVMLMVFSFLVTLCACCFIRHKFCRGEEHEQGTGRDNGRGRPSNQSEAPRRQRRQRPEEREQRTGRDNGRGQRSNRGEAPRRQRAPVAAAPAAVLDVELTQEPVLECTFRMADGWEETMCSVCQSEMADGEKVRVLTACTHSFHTTCVEQWLRDHATCPLCRAPTSAAPAKDRRHRRPTT